MQAALDTWADDPAIHLVILDGAGDRGLCAGGDIRYLHDSVHSGHPEKAAQFIKEEYRLNLTIARYAKPYVAFMDGIVMGGGIGVSAHGSHRIVTERSLLAMPETSIGFIPDVGGTYLLSRAPDELGTHLALTSARVGAADAILCELADYHVSHNKLTDLTHDLTLCVTPHDVEHLIQTRSTKPAPGAFGDPWVTECYAHQTVEEILEALDDRPAATEIRAKSPTMLKVTLRALRKARLLQDLEACLRMEYQIGCACFAHTDFVEGVRAAIIDKDRNPRWNPARLEDVTEAMVDSYFRA